MARKAKGRILSAKPVEGMTHIHSRATVEVQHGKRTYTMSICAGDDGLQVEISEDENGQSVADQEWSWEELAGE